MHNYFKVFALYGVSRRLLDNYEKTKDDDSLRKLFMQADPTITEDLDIWCDVILTAIHDVACWSHGNKEDSI